MKRMRIMGLCLVAAFALSAFAVSSASALPEVGRCVPKALGKYTDANCNVKAVKGNGTKEFVKGSGGLNGWSAAGGEAFLEGESGTKIICTSQTAVGKYDEDTGAIKESENVTATYQGCNLPLIEGSCQNGAAGEIKTNSLHGPLGYISKAKKEVGQELTPEVKNGAFVEFECGGGAVKVVVKVATKGGHNCIINNQGPVNTMSTTATSKYKETKGIQEPNHFEGKTECNLESKVIGEPERSGQSQEDIITGETAVELRA